MSDNLYRIITAIENAFQGVQLESGISLREAIVLDNYGMEEERREAVLQDASEQLIARARQIIGKIKLMPGNPPAPAPAPQSADSQNPANK